eukprot:gnl/Chilomastix_caulleri/742.p1 GENE.gnl/Chilomastix_caulleri/742~~gnl/Chilomastix_caulleri/742.p1  ORF type:complete len:161 (+),score=3.31 gnl/Chilomastix_caulleri/742:102-584(+)
MGPKSIPFKYVLPFPGLDDATANKFRLIFDGTPLRPNVLTNIYIHSSDPTPDLVFGITYEDKHGSLSFKSETFDVNINLGAVINEENPVINSSYRVVYPVEGRKFIIEFNSEFYDSGNPPHSVSFNEDRSKIAFSRPGDYHLIVETLEGVELTRQEFDIP